MSRLNAILCFALMLSAAMLSAQSGAPAASEPNSKIWRHGFIVTQRNDTIRGLIQILSPNKDSAYDFQHQLSFDDGRNTISYTPSALVSFTYFTGTKQNGKQVSFDRTKNPERDGLVFAKRYVRGACNVFGYRSTRMDIAPGNIALYTQRETKYLQIGDLAVAVHEEDFGEYLKQLFAQCPLILSKLNSEKYKSRDWMKMVQEYNAGKCK